MNTSTHSPVLEIFVLGYGAFADTTRLCLDSLLPQAQTLNISVVVGDNGSPDDSAVRLQEFIDESQSSVLKSRIFVENHGFSGGMNRLIDEASASWLLLVGSDTIFEETALKNLLSAIDSATDQISIIGPLTNQAGTAQRLDLGGDSPALLFERWRLLQPLKRLTPLHRADFFCVAIRHTLWKHLGGLDTRYGRGYYEDVDFCERARAAKAKIAMCEDSFVFHRGGASFSRDPRQHLLIRKNKSLFMNRFPHTKLKHIREDLYDTCLELLANGSPSASLLDRVRLRIHTIENQKPKGLLKRLFWRHKTQHLRNQLRQHTHA